MRVTKKRFKSRRTNTLLAFCSGFLVGLLAVIHAVPGFHSAVWQIALLVLLLLSIKAPLLALGLVIGVSLGWWRGIAEYRLVQPLQALYGQIVTVSGVATLDGVYGDKGDLAFRLAVKEIVLPNRQPVDALIKVSGFGERSIIRSDTLLVTGKLRPARGAAIGTISFATIETQTRSANPLERMRLFFGAGLQSALPEPHGSLGLGLLIGQRTTLSETFQADLTTVGLVHIIAVSGYNLTILVTAASRILGKLSKYQSLLASLVLISVFLAISGLAASLVRAAMISVLSLGATYYGRRIKPVVLLFVAAAATAAITPQYIWFDLGWYLSFTAFAGVILIAPAAKVLIYGAKEPKLIGGLLLETISAQLATLPLIMYLFGRLSIISLPANMAIVPLLPLTMLCSVCAGVAGMMHLGWMTGVIAWPSRILLGYIVEATGFFADAPFAEVTFFLQARSLAGIYTILASVVYIVWRRRKPGDNTLKDAII